MVKSVRLVFGVVYFILCLQIISFRLSVNNFFLRSKGSGLGVHGSCKRYCVARDEVGLHPMAAIKLPLQDLAKGIHSPIVVGGGGSI
jgi:hypothetical protein